MSNCAIFEGLSGRQIAVNPKLVRAVTPGEHNGRETLTISFDNEHEVNVYGEFRESLRMLFA